MQIKFEHPETKVEYQIKTDKKFILVYGKNGSGKTTLTRNTSFNKKLVFNEDFVNENIYTISESGAILSSDNKKNFSKLWIGSDIVSKSKEVEEFNESIKYNKGVLDQLKGIVSDEMNKASVDATLQLDEFVKPDFEIVMKDFEDKEADFNSELRKETTIKDDAELDQHITSIKNDKLLSMLHEKIKNSILLNDLFFCNGSIKTIENINNSISEIAEFRTILIKIDQELKQKNIGSEEVRNQIELWVKLHEDRNSCLFCGNTDISQSLNDWKQTLKSEEMNKKTELINQIDKYISDCNGILSEKESYYEIDKDTIDAVISINDILISKRKEYINNTFTKLVISMDGISSELKGISEITIAIKNYIINKHINKLVFYVSNDKKLVERREELKIELGDAMDKNGKKYADGINDTLSDLGLNKAVDFTVNKRTTPYTYEFKLVENRALKTLSDGQKHKLALAMFLFSLKEKEYKDQIIVIDDPVVSLDVLSYHQVKTFFIKNLISTFKDNGDVKLIILTHNINYLYVQLSNVFDDIHMNSITEVYRLGTKKIDKVSLDLLKTDDITLFKILVAQLQGMNGFRLLPCIILKIFRLMIDIRLRFNGTSSTEGVGIKSLNMLETTKAELQNYSNYLSKSFKGDKVQDDQTILEAMHILKKSAEFLGFGELLNDAEVKKIEDIVKVNDTSDILDHPCFDIVQQVNDFFISSNDHDLKDYVRHPRNTFTKNMVTLCLNNDI